MSKIVFSTFNGKCWQWECGMLDFTQNYAPLLSFIPLPTVVTVNLTEVLNDVDLWPMKFALVCAREIAWQIGLAHVWCCMQSITFLKDCITSSMTGVGRREGQRVGMVALRWFDQDPKDGIFKRVGKETCLRVVTIFLYSGKHSVSLSALRFSQQIMPQSFLILKIRRFYATTVSYFLHYYSKWQILRVFFSPSLFQIGLKTLNDMRWCDTLVFTHEKYDHSHTTLITHTLQTIGSLFLPLYSVRLSGFRSNWSLTEVFFHFVTSFWSIIIEFSPKQRCSVM